MPNPSPKTIEELKAWYNAHNLPPEEVTRFFIGKDIKEARVFGIYQDGDRYVVYKNKNDGSRAIRYEGPDEAYAVNELYMKLKQEISNQKGRNTAEAADLAAENRRKTKFMLIAFSIFFAICLGLGIWQGASTPSRGYYHYNDDWYYYQDDLWYYYDDTWNECDQAPGPVDQYQDYYAGDNYSDVSGNCTDFAATDYYRETDSDSTWSSSDSWDSGSTDFDSDW